MIKLKDHSLYDDKRKVVIRPKVFIKPDWNGKPPKPGIFGKDGNCK